MSHRATLDPACSGCLGKSFGHTCGLAGGMNMWETVSIDLKVQLPRDIAKQALGVHHTDPDFLARVILYGLTRRSIYRHLRERSADKLREWDEDHEGDRTQLVT